MGGDNEFKLNERKTFILAELVLYSTYSCTTVTSVTDAGVTYISINIEILVVIKTCKIEYPIRMNAFLWNRLCIRKLILYNY